MIPFKKLDEVMTQAQRNKAEKREVEDQDQQVLANILRQLSGEIDDLSKNEAQEIGRDKLHTSAPNQSRGAHRREGSDK